MKRLPRIIKIISVRNFVVKTLWNNGEIRDIDFKPLLAQWSADEETRYAPLNDARLFKTVAVSPDHTLQWPKLMTKLTFRGITKESPLDLDPDVLFEKSKLVEQHKPLHVGHILKAAREDAGLSQTEVAQNSGTTRNYISRIENEKSDIQVDTLYKIVTLGMGKQLSVSIK